ncbi:hypothetical protein [Flavobacterium pygoscelis]|nr:hypothetical protein [Flavobacterium pygoscelis]
MSYIILFTHVLKCKQVVGPEMKSTGKSILFIDDLKDDQFYEL